MDPVIFMMYRCLLDKKDLARDLKNAMEKDAKYRFTIFGICSFERSLAMIRFKKENYKLFNAWKLFSPQYLFSFATHYWIKEGTKEDGKT